MSALDQHIAKMLDQAWVWATNRKDYTPSQYALAIKIIRLHSVF